MVKILLPFLAIASSILSSAGEKPQADGLYELRTYIARPGKMEPLLARFRDHTLRLFEKHGMSNVAYWVPVGDPGDTLIYLRSFADAGAREAATGSFKSDPEWRKVAADSEKNGELVESIKAQLMEPLDFSREFTLPDPGAHIYEMRTYVASPGNLAALHSRFRDHTLALFEKHGMSNLGYFRLLPDQEGAGETLIYFLAHKDREAAKQSWADFAADPDWISAKKASETAAGGSLTQEGGVKSVFLEPTDFSPLK